MLTITNTRLEKSFLGKFAKDANDIEKKTPLMIPKNHDKLSAIANRQSWEEEIASLSWEEATDDEGRTLAESEDLKINDAERLLSDTEDNQPKPLAKTQFNVNAVTFVPTYSKQ